MSVGKAWGNARGNVHSRRCKRQYGFKTTHRLGQTGRGNDCLVFVHISKQSGVPPESGSFRPIIILGEKQSSGGTPPGRQKPPLNKWVPQASGPKLCTQLAICDLADDWQCIGRGNAAVKQSGNAQRQRDSIYSSGPFICDGCNVVSVIRQHSTCLVCTPSAAVFARPSSKVLQCLCSFWHLPTFDQISGTNMASDCYVLVLTLQLNFLAKRRFGDQVHIWPNFLENMASDCYVLVLTLQFNFVAKCRFGDQVHIWPNFGENMASDCYVLVLALQLYFIAKPRFGDQAHIWPNFGEKYGLRLLCSAVNFAIKLYCKMSIWWSGPHLTKFRSKRWPPIFIFCC
jgi:hypothetical protein